MNKLSSYLVGLLLVLTSTVFADIERVSLSNTGEQANSVSFYSDLSSDGRYSTFDSVATNLVIGDTNRFTGQNGEDVFRHDVLTGETIRASVSSTGEQADFDVNQPQISDDGRFITFFTSSTTLVDDDLNGHQDIFLHDVLTGQTSLVSRDANGVPLSGVSTSPSISGDGSVIVFASLAEGRGIFRHDVVLGQTTKVVDASVNVFGSEGERTSVDNDGSHLAYFSFPPFSSNSSVYVYNHTTGENQLVSASTDGVPAGGISDWPSISGDGSYVAFQTNSDNLIVNDTNNVSDVYVKNMQSGEITRVSVSSSGGQGNVKSGEPSISADGRYVAFFSSATNLIDNDTNGGTSDVYVHDIETGRTALVSVSATGEQGNNRSRRPSISADGRKISFLSWASNLVPDDTNNFQDIFVADNPLFTPDDNLVTVEKLINNETRETLDVAAKLSTGTQYRQSYKVTNNSTNRIYQVKVFENGNMVCNFFALNPGQTRQRCDTLQTVLDGEQYMQVNVSAKVSGSGETLANSTDAYYTGPECQW